MKYDPMRQADVERRLSNLAKARRCGARTRAGHACKQAAVRGRARCRMHGGGASSGALPGNTNALTHGFHTRDAILERRQLQDLVRRSRQLLKEIE